MAAPNTRAPFPAFLNPAGRAFSYIYATAVKKGLLQAKSVVSPDIIETLIEKSAKKKLGMKEFEQNFGAQARASSPFKEALMARTVSLSYFEIAKDMAEKLNNSSDLFIKYFNPTKTSKINKEELDEIEKQCISLNYDFDILDSYVRVETWLTRDLPKGIVPKPERQGSQTLLTLGEIIFLLSLIDIATEIKTLRNPAEKEDYNLNLLTADDISSLQKKIIIKSSKFGVKDAAIDEAVTLTRKLKIGSLPKILHLDLLFPIGKAMHLTHYAMNGTTSRLHHLAYIGNRTIVECLTNQAQDSLRTSALVMSIKSVRHALENARNRNSPLYYVKYENPYPFRAIRKRALWTVGLFPSYDILSRNCESPVSWMFENQLVGGPSHCIIDGPKPKVNNAEIRMFWKNILDTTAEVTPIPFRNILKGLKGGIRTRKNSKYKNRRVTRNKQHAY
jgi:hypothetical protein